LAAKEANTSGDLELLGQCFQARAFWAIANDVACEAGELLPNRSECAQEKLMAFDRYQITHAQD